MLTEFFSSRALIAGSLCCSLLAVLTSGCGPNSMHSDLSEDSDVNATSNHRKVTNKAYVENSAELTDEDPCPCREDDSEEETDSGADATPNTEPVIECPDDLPYASEVVSFTPGDNAGFGKADMPQVVLGPPSAGPPTSGSLDVLTLGLGGEIVLSFGSQAVIDGPGPDLIVWENPFWIGANPDNVFAELGEVSVSLDGEEWHTFPCDPSYEPGYDEYCAGWRPRTEYDVCSIVPIEPAAVGGDAFDLADLGLTEIRYVKIRDLSDEGAAPSAGFDLDAIGAVHLTDN